MQIIYLALANFFKDSIFLNFPSCTENCNQELGSIMFWDTLYIVVFYLLFISLFLLFFSSSLKFIFVAGKNDFNPSWISLIAVQSHPPENPLSLLQSPLKILFH